MRYCCFLFSYFFCILPIKLINRIFISTYTDKRIYGLFVLSNKVCAEQEKNKGCLCLTPTTLQKSEENETETSFSDKEDVVPNQPKAMSQTRTQLIDNPNVVSSSSGGEPSTTNIIESGGGTDHEDIVLELNQPNRKSSIPEEVSQEDEKCNAKSEQKVDFSECTASVNTDSLKMLSLLDFAGHSAYYACHHIFFSPRAFFILVVDMTKELESIATEACRKEGLIYSNWTYAGIENLKCMYFRIKYYALTP